ncbi:hypothetical protein Tco_0623011 [Tanacetum coccineum]
MESYLPFEYAGCGQPSDDFYCYSCKCQECGCHLSNGICKICTYDGENPIDFSTPYSFNESPNFSYHPTHSQPILYQFYGIDARYGHYCTPQVPIISNPEPCYYQDYDEFPQTLPSFPQQYPCYEDCGGPHMTFQCQLMNYYEPNPCYDYNYSGFDQIEPPQFPVIHQPPQEMSMEALQAREDLMKSIENFLKKFNRISFRETPKVLMQAWDKFLEIKHACKEKQHQSEEVQELLNKLLQDLQSINEELAEFINTPKTESDKFIKFSVEDLVQNPSEFEDERECDVPDFDDSQTKNFSTFSNPLFDDSSFNDDESSHEEVIHEMSFKTYSNPLFDLDEEIISSEFNLIHNEDLDSTLKNDLHGEIITIPPRIVNREHEEYISLLEKLLYDNSSIRPPEDFHANPNTINESLPTFPIPVEDSDSLRE